MATSGTRYTPMDVGKGKLRKKRKKLLNSSTDASLRPTAKRKPPVLSTASGLLNMLKEKHPILKLHALNNLNVFMERFWPEISADIAQIESLYEDEHFEHRRLAALVASKVFYHLGELAESLTYALGADSLFNVSDNSEYVQTLVAKCVDEYISINSRLEKGEEGLLLDPRLIAIVERVLDQCLVDGKSEQAVGIALECRRLDKLEEAITRSRDPGARLTYCLKLSQTFVNSREFRREVLRLLVENYQKLREPDYLSLCHCLMLLDEAHEVARVLQRLVQGEGDSALLAYQVAFDLFEDEDQKFLARVRQFLQDSVSEVPERHSIGDSNTKGRNPTTPLAPSEHRAGNSETGDSNRRVDTLEPQLGNCSDALPSTSRVSMNASGSAPLEVEQHHVGESSSRGRNVSYFERLKKLNGILTGDIPISLHLHFLHSNNRSDLSLLKSMKQSLETRNSICHSAVIYTNALLHAGTTVDTFLRENLDWLRCSTNWGKFSATAGLGVIYRGHLQQGISLLSSYLPQHRGSPFSEGGALYALGLIYANRGERVRHFLTECLRNANHEVIQHGACLGIGLAGLGTADDEIYEEVKQILYKDSAVAGEAAGIAMGLIYVGSGTDKAGEMLAYAQDTQHEKITRGLALGIALTVYGRENEADSLIERMTRDQNPVLRYGGMFAWAMAYKGTANTTAIRRLLHHAVSDVSDDVKRTAVIALGFVLCTQPEQTPRIVSLLAESHNAYVRYGASLAIGISCAGTASKRAIALLEPLVTDQIDFVRQGGLIGMAMVLLQHTEAYEPRVGPFRQRIEGLIKDRYEEPMTKMGAILAQGILDAGGRNVNILLRSRNGHCRMTATVGMAVFCQFWYWYPLIYFISLSFCPTAFIGLTEDLRVPSFDFVSQVKPSMFAYPPTTSPPVEVSKATKVQAATLSIVTKRTRVATKDRKIDDVKVGSTIIQEASTSYVPVSHSPKSSGSKRSHDVDHVINKADMPWTRSRPDTPKRSETTFATGEPSRNSNLVSSMAREQSDVNANLSQGGQVDLPEPTSEILCNPTRVVPAQVKFVHFPENNRFAPLLPNRPPSGFVMLQDRAPSDPAEYVWDVDVYTQATPQSPFGAPEIMVERNDAHHTNPFLHP
ncbi:hypothetical protein KC19_3G002300 [Ceratodon purpureus]|uniref:26S proteasome non-ATPase regulatory subunit 1 homolog n=1 Tax=Ceratodon purpureus TaxID=3225 RepID=A0A8T0IFP2_CERPU|nr:hypothetical protein KC19_3G002300 [Ceratodon purpureus]